MTDKLRIALIQPPIEDFYITDERSYPLGLTYLAGAVANLPVSVEILDFLSGGQRRTIRVPKVFAPVLPHFRPDRSPIKIFQQYYHFGKSWTDIETHFQNNQYELIAVSSNFYTYADEALETVRLARKHNPQALIILGGQNSLSGLDHLQNETATDAIILGEGELPFRQLVENLINQNETKAEKSPWDINKAQYFENIPNLFYKSQSKWKGIKQISQEKCYQYQPVTPGLNYDHYRITGKRSRMLNTTRGCPMGCSFCTIPQFWGKKLRFRPIPEILKELEAAASDGVEVIDIEDDNFTLNKYYAVKLLSAIEEKFGRKFDFYAMNGLMAETLDDESLEIMARLGFKMVNISLATLKNESLKAMHRREQAQAFRRVSEKANALGMKGVGYFIAGLPNESVQDVLKTMTFLAELPLILGISPFYYIPGIAVEGLESIPKNKKEARLTRFFPASSNWDELTLITLFRLSRWINYLKGKISAVGLKQIAFSKAVIQFADDAIITALIREKSILGIDEKRRFYKHDVNHSVVTSFLKAMQWKQIHSA
jgi:anaerobic magnesium-protoporphyrin IX monomethyl ester cyclase